MAVAIDDLQHISRHLTCQANFKDKHLFITGATGFIGKWMLESLLYLNDKMALNMQLTLLSRNPEKFINESPDIAKHPIINWIKGDVRDFNFPDIQVDIIIHAATEASAKLNVEAPLEMVDVIYQGTKHILEFSKQAKATNFLLLSSGAVYGKQPDSINGFLEDFEGAPNALALGSAYAEGKRLSELMAVSEGRETGMSVKIARCFAFAGPYLDVNKHYAVGNFVQNVINNEDIIIKGDGKPLRSYMYAADLIIWLWEILHRGNDNEAYNVGSDKAISIKDLAEEVAKFSAGTNVKVLNQVALGQRNQNYIPNVSKAKKQLNLKVRIQLEESISRFINFLA